MLEVFHRSENCSFCNLFSSISSMIKEHMGDHVKKHFAEKMPNACIESTITVKNVVVHNNAEDGKDDDSKDIKDSIKFVEKGIFDNNIERPQDFVVSNVESRTITFDDNFKMEKLFHDNRRGDGKDNENFLKSAEKNMSLETRFKQSVVQNSVIKRNDVYEKKNVDFIQNNFFAESMSPLDKKLSEDLQYDTENVIKENDKCKKKTNIFTENNYSGENMDILSDELNISRQYESDNKNDKDEYYYNGTEIASYTDFNQDQLVKDNTTVDHISNFHPKNNLVKRPFDQLLKEYYKKEGHSFKCNICAQVFYALSNLKEHVISVHKENHADAEHICNICGAKFLRKSSLKNHSLRHEPAVNCEKCEKPFTTKISLMKHQKLNCNNSGAQEIEICELCGKGFKSSYLVNYHYKTVHLNLRPFKCSICSKLFKTFSCFQTHCLGVHKIAKDETRQYLIMVKPEGESIE